MAFTPVVPVTLNIVITQGAGQLFTAPAINSPSGTAVDLSAWVSLAAKIVPPAPTPTGGDATFGTVTGGTGGSLTLETSATDLATVAPGSAQLRIYGKPTSGDSLQLLATGSVTIQAG
jgi:hypothetical protein